MAQLTRGLLWNLLARTRGWQAWRLVDNLRRLPETPPATPPVTVIPPHECNPDLSTSDGGADLQERVAAWEADRALELAEAGRYERDGLSLLAKAACLRAAVLCEDRGWTTAARELRRQADPLAVIGDADTLSGPRLHVFAGETSGDPAA